jgi:hypothetical protein
VSSLVRKRNLGLGLTGKAIMLLLAEFASDDGSGIWASKATMARELETTERTIQRTIKALIDAGYVSMVGKKKHRNGETFEYAINLSAVKNAPDPKASPPTEGRPDSMSPPTEGRVCPDTVSPHDPTEGRPNHTKPKGTTPQPPKGGGRRIVGVSENVRKLVEQNS